MSKSGAKRHTHKYRKLQSQIWACAFADCTHYMPLNLSDNMEGKASICWTCGNVMILDERALKMDKPNCQSCENKLHGIADAEGFASVIDAVLGGAELKDGKIIRTAKAPEFPNEEVTDMDEDDDGRLY